MDVQAEFFKEIKLKIKDNELIAQLLCSILDIKPDSAYRRIRGKTELTFKEVAELSAYFNISLDTVLYKHRKSTFGNYIYYNLDTVNIANDYITFLVYLSGILEQTFRSQDKEIILTAQEVPTIHTMLYDKLSLFKLYACYRNEAGNKPLTYDKFLLALHDYQNILNEYHNKITSFYRRIPSIEIWSDSTLDSFLHLLEYCIDIQCFEDNSHVEEICRQLEQLVGTVESWSEQGLKGNEGGPALFSMYRSPVNVQNNYTYILKDGQGMVFIKMFAINGLFTDNELIVSDTSRWIRSLTTVSQHLSKVSERERICFFNTFRNRIKRLLVKTKDVLAKVV